MRRLTLIGCGKAKLDHPAQAQDLYTGSQFTTNRAAAEALGYPWAVINAHHGVTFPTTILEPYEHAPLHGDEKPPPMIALKVRVALLEWDQIICLTSKAYTAMAERAAPGRVLAVYADAKGMGYQRAVAARIRDTGNLPAPFDRMVED